MAFMSDPSLSNSTTDPQRRGEVYALGLTLIESWFPVVAFFTVGALGGLHAYFYSLCVAVACLLVWWLWRKRWVEILKSRAYFALAMTSLFITSLFALTFVGLQYTTPTNVAIILFLQILFSYLFLGRREGERLQRLHLLGAVLMTLGALMVLFPGRIELRLGDALVLLAAMIAPFANMFQKKARAHVSSETILLVRSVLALPLIWVLALWLEPQPGWVEVQQQWLGLFLTGFLVFFVAKLLWVEAIYLLPITKVNALFAFSPLMTMGWNYWVLGTFPDVWQVAGMLPILLGGYWITRGRP